MRLNHAVFAAFFLIFTSGAVKAEPYFTSDTVMPTLLTPPIEVKGEEWNKEIDHIIALQVAPDAKEVEKSAAERNMSPEMVSVVVDPKLTREGYPALYHLLDNVSDTSYHVTDGAKKYWKTRRPYIMDTRVKALIEAHDNPAYPSGHTTGSYVWAHVLGLIIPDKREAFIARAEEIAQHRVLVGMHYPHDVAGGKQLALLIVGGLLQNDQFKKDLLKAQGELGEKGYY